MTRRAWRRHVPEVGGAERLAAARAGEHGERGVDGERGSITIPLIGLIVVILGVCALGVAITGVHLDRNELQARADGAALAASQGLDPAVAYVKGARPVDPQEARRRAREYLRSFPEVRDGLEDIAIAAVDVDPDGRVRVTLTARAHPPLASWFTHRTGMAVPLSARGSARAI